MTMSGAATDNVHATAIVLGATGILITGPSGSGKSEMALCLIEAARARGLFSTLVSDDQVLVKVENGRVLAEAPAAIEGLLEIRGSGLCRVDYLKAAVMDFSVRPVPFAQSERMPPSDMQFTAGGVTLPMLACLWPSPDPFSKLAALAPGLAQGRVARPHRVTDD